VCDNKSLKRGWKTWRFDQMATNVNVRIDNPSESGMEHYIGLEHLDPDSLKIRRWGTPDDVEATKLIFKKGDIIFGRRRAYQRKLGVAEFDGICSAHAMVLRAKPEVVLPEFLPFFMQSDLFMKRAVEISVGSLSPTINWKTMAAQEFALPPISEQRELLEVLTAAQGCVIAYEGAKHAHEQLVSSFIQESFSSFDKEFEHRPCTDLMDKITVGIVVKPADLYVPAGKGVRALRSLNVLPGKFALDDVVEISVEGHAQHQKSALQTGDIAIVRTGRPGDAAVVTSDLANTNCIDLIVARPGASVSADYAVAFLNSQFGRRIFSSGTTGTAQQHFNVGEFSKLKLPVPPLGAQLEFVSRLTALRTPIQAIEKRLQDARFTMATVLSTSMLGA
jgi:type I restriction enzyme S subunit